MRHVLCSIGLVLLLLSQGITGALAADPRVISERFTDASLATWQRVPPEFSDLHARDYSVVMTAPRWSYLTTREKYRDARVMLEFSILEPARQANFFGETWSVWPDPTFGDGGYDAALLLRANQNSGYRVQVSHKYQDVALVKYPQGGYVQVVPWEHRPNTVHKLVATITGTEITVTLNGKEILRYQDGLLPLTEGVVGFGVNAGARVRVTAVDIQPAPRSVAITPLAPQNLPKLNHVPQFSTRRWLGDRVWVFDGREPILLLPSPQESYINNVKLRPGYKPQLSWNSHWDIQNQGAYPEGTNRTENVVTTGGGETLTATWSAKQTDDKFRTATIMVISFDHERGAYTYDIASTLEVQPGAPFYFRYGYDFEHHTPLDPFRWQYLVVKRQGNDLRHRPVYPIDPGVMTDVEQYRGLRMWYGRHAEDMLLAPAVEYLLPNAGERALNTAVCAAFYDTGVSFAAETAPPGTKVRVNYRYTGYPTAEAEKIFQASKIYDSAMLDPHHHYIFAEEWPTVTFRHYLPMSKTWIYGKRPFQTAHNARPTYSVLKDAAIAHGHAMRLGPRGVGKASLPIPQPLPAGNYEVSTYYRLVNTHGLGGKVELEATSKTGQVLTKVDHYLGNGSCPWQSSTFVLNIPKGTHQLNLALTNLGTGIVDIAEVDFQRLEANARPAQEVLLTPRATPPAVAPVPAGAWADYRMQEGDGFHVFDYAQGPFGYLENANLNWVIDNGRPALVFADPTNNKVSGYARSGVLENSYLNHPAYLDKRHLPVAIAGHHGGGITLQGLTMASWIKPAAAMGKSTHGGKGDIIGVGARRFILSLYGQEAPYRLGARLNVNDSFVAPEPNITANRWYHVAMTCAPQSGQWDVTLFVDGKVVQRGLSKNYSAPTTIPPSIILGAEIFYLHDAYYRGLIGRTLVFNKALSPAAVAELMKNTNH